MNEVLWLIIGFLAIVYVVKSLLPKHRDMSNPFDDYESNGLSRSTDSTAPKPKKKPKPYSPTNRIDLNIPRITSNQFMSPEEKYAYLQSPMWQAKREIVLKRDKHQCVVCGTDSTLEIHHITYANLGNERIDQLVTLCRKHHQEVHDKYGYDRTTEYPIN